MAGHRPWYCVECCVCGKLFCGHEGAGKGCQRAATAASGRGGDTCAAVPRDAFGSGVKERSVAAAVRVIESQRRAAAQRCGVRVSAAWHEVGRRLELTWV